MYMLDIKKSEKQSLEKGEKKLMPENLKKKTASASQFLKPNYPNMFQCRKKDTYINENTILQHEADVMGTKAVRKKYFSTYPVPVTNFNSNQPIQRKLVFRGMEQKVEFVRTYRSKPAELDEFTALDGEIKKISEESQALDGKETELIQNMVRHPDYYYIGNKNNIVSILTEMYYKLKQLAGIPQNNEQGRINLIKLAIDRMYNQANDVKISDVNISKLKYSQNLIGAVRDNINFDEQKGLSEYELWNQHPANQSAGAGKTVTTVDRGRSHHLMFGKYVYRTMESEELEALTSHSTYSDGKYTINDFRDITIGKHVGNLTQAVTYGGILVRFEMKSDFNRAILNQIGRNEGTRNPGSIGMKYENEGMLKNNAHQSSFSFYIPSEVAGVFLSNVASFEVFNLGKTFGLRRG